MNTNQVDEITALFREISWRDRDLLMTLRDQINQRINETYVEQRAEERLERVRQGLRASIDEAPDFFRGVMGSIHIEEVFGDGGSSVKRFTLGFDRGIILQTLNDIKKLRLKEFAKGLISDYADSFVRVERNLNESILTVGSIQLALQGSQINPKHAHQLLEEYPIFKMCARFARYTPDSIRFIMPHIGWKWSGWDHEDMNGLVHEQIQSKFQFLLQQRRMDFPVQTEFLLWKVNPCYGNYGHNEDFSDQVDVKPFKAMVETIPDEEITELYLMVKHDKPVPENLKPKEYWMRKWDPEGRFFRSRKSLKRRFSSL